MNKIIKINTLKRVSMRLASLIFLLMTVSTIPGIAQSSSHNKQLFEGQIAPLLDGMGDHHFEISTEDTLVARYFDQGIMLTYGFNHAEAERTFRQIAALEPDNAMAWWGVALVQGPNINMPMLPEAAPIAWEALQKALERKDNATQRERDYINALATRYTKNPPEDRTPLDEAYAKAMGELVQKYPNDLDARTLYAEALMDLHPWDYWTKDGEPREWTSEILETLEYVMERNPGHPGANHLYIHATEASKTPEKALESANRLRKAVPGAGHLVHMPSHTYIRVGMYHEGTLANQRAVAADNEYVTQCRQQGIYPLGYVPHNHHFLWATATLEGRKQLSTKAAISTYEQVNTELMREPGLGTLQHFRVIPLYSHVRFGRWDDILSYPEPAPDLIYPMGVWHYARGMAFLGKGQLEDAENELDNLKVIAADDTLKEVTIWDINTTKELMQIASRTDREDLQECPQNGWSLFGLYQSLTAQGKTGEAKDVRSQFEEAWKYADIELKSSRIM